MDITLVFTVALAAAFVVVVLVLVVIIIYQRWRIGDQNVFIERFIRQNENIKDNEKDYDDACSRPLLRNDHEPYIVLTV